jgi:hypothetical protein
LSEEEKEPSLVGLLLTLLLIGLVGYMASTAATSFNFVNNLLTATLPGFRSGNLLPDPYPLYVMVGGAIVTALLLVIAFKVAYALRRGE